MSTFMFPGRYDWPPSCTQVYMGFVYIL